MRLYHESSSGHESRQVTLRHISREYFWPGMAADIGNFVSKCHVCQNGEVESCWRPDTMLTPPTAPTPPSGQYTGSAEDRVECVKAVRNLFFSLVTPRR